MNPTDSTEITILCPKCGEPFPLSEAIAHEVREKLIADERDRIRADEERKAAPRIEALQQELQDRERDGTEARKRELELLRQMRGMKRREEEAELQRERDLAQLRKAARQEADKAATDRFQANLNQKDEQLRRLQRDLEELRRQASTGPLTEVGVETQKLLGEELEELFPDDLITVIRQGQRGGDIKHAVTSPGGRTLGTLLWESKDAQAWSDAWLDKVRDDARDAGADVAVIVSRAMPTGIRSVGLVKDVVVLTREYAGVVAVLLRQQVLQAARHRLSAAADEGTAERVLRCLTTGPFMSRLARMLEEASGIKHSVETEKRAMERRWGDQINRADRIAREVAGVVVDLDAQGAELPSIPQLELPAA